MILAKVFRSTWGPKPSAAKWAYTGIVRPAFSYGCIIWADKAQSDGMIAKLKKLQRLALLLIAPVRRSTPTAALELIYDVKPLHLFLKECALKSCLRVGITNPNWLPRSTKGHHHILYDALPAAVKERPCDSVKCTTIWEQNYSVTIGDGKDIKEKREWTCYTDGSKIRERAGAGSVILCLGEKVDDLSFSVGKAEVFQA